MDAELRERLERVAEEHALYNALKHGAEAEVGAIMGPLMGEHPEFRPHGDDVPGVIAPVVASVNDLDPVERRDRLGELAPDRLAELEEETADDDDATLPPLPGVGDGDPVRLRCAPNPNGPWHIGHARMGAVVGRYAERYDGWMVCRFDDTDPATKRPDLAAYDAILEDLEYLGFDPDAVLRASDRLEIYYDHARRLIECGGAYPCSCPPEEFSRRKAAGEACPHRDAESAETAEIFEAMVDGEYTAGDMVLRVRTDLTAENPAIRDWVAFRMIDEPHPRDAAASYRCWPMLDFQSAIDDHLTEITHIIRGKDLQDCTPRQAFVYDYFDWDYPEVLLWGRISVDEYEMPLSTSELRAMIDTGDLSGWDDPRAPTLRSLARRGIQGPAVTAALAELGVSDSAVELSMSSIYAKNRERIDHRADRYFLVRDGQAFHVTGDIPAIATPPKHPDDPDRGTREIPVGDQVMLEPADVPDHGDRVWLKGFGCVRLTRDALHWTGDDIEVVRSGDVPVVHWVPADGTVSVQVLEVDGQFTGVAEPEFGDLATDTVIQFERIGFGRVDEWTDDSAVVCFAHG